MHNKANSNSFIELHWPNTGLIPKGTPPDNRRLATYKLEIRHWLLRNCHWEIVNKAHSIASVIPKLQLWVHTYFCFRRDSSIKLMMNNRKCNVLLYSLIKNLIHYHKYMRLQLLQTFNLSFYTQP